MMLFTIKQNKFKIGGAFFCLILWEIFAQALKSSAYYPFYKRNSISAFRYYKNSGNLCFYFKQPYQDFYNIVYRFLYCISFRYSFRFK